LPEPLQVDLELTGKADRELIGALGRRERVGVIAIFEVRSVSGQRIGSFGSSSARAELRATGQRVLSRLPEGRVDLVHQYRGFGAIAVETDAEGLLALLAQPEVTHAGLDEPMTWSLAEALPLAGVSGVRRAGKNGKGVWVAVLDSGVDTDHKDLSKPLKAQECFCSPACCPDGTSRQSGKGSAEDDVGHGTLVSGAIVSRGKVAPRGAAMKAKLLMIKMGGQRGPASSDALAALDYVLNEMPEVRVINMSFGTIKTWGGNCDKKGAANRAYAAVFDALSVNGTLAFAATGNDGVATRMSSPACIRDVISVGAVYDDDFGANTFGSCQDPTSGPNQLACFTTRSAKTDLVAPGVVITAPSFDGGAASVAGTSFSSPIAAGCGVLLRKKFPGATREQLEAALESSPTTAIDPVNGRGYPALDCGAAFAFLSKL
jgi:subtilisin family serine protease